MKPFAALAALTLALTSGIAHAEYAPPPDREDYPRYDDPSSYPPDPEPIDSRPRSTVRAFTGPAVRFADSTQGGLALALDVGARPAGARVGAAWLRAGSDRGLAQYVAELWIDFDEDGVLHPILAAGGGIARLDRTAPDGDVETSTVGIGVLRGTLQYRLPVRRVDARAALDLTGAVPAFRADGTSGNPWATATLMVGVGF